MEVFEGPTGFSFVNCRRNCEIVKDPRFKGLVPTPKKTGTTIVGVVYSDGVVVGADTRSTAGEIVVEKNCLKIHFLTENIFCCGAGTAADTAKLTDMMSKRLNLMALNSGRKMRVKTAVTMLKQHLFRHQGYISAHLIVGGVDCSGPHLYSVSHHGHTDSLPYLTMGSGCLAAISFFENNYRLNFSLEEAKQFIRNGIYAGVFNDLGSGSNVDMCVITKHGAEMLRNHEKLATRVPQLRDYTFPVGTTRVIRSGVATIPYEVVSSEATTTSASKMELD